MPEPHLRCYRIDGLEPVFGASLEQRYGEAVEVEALLLRQMARGDKAGLTGLWDAWSRPLFAIAMRGLQNVEDAEEALQDAMVKYWEKAAEYDATRSKPFSWGVMILRGLVMDRLRLRQRRPVLVSGNFEDKDMPAPLHEPDRISETDFRAAMALLTPQERQLVELAVFAPGTHEELAAHLDQPLGTVKSRIRKAMEKLKQALLES